MRIIEASASAVALAIAMSAPVSAQDANATPAETAPSDAGEAADVLEGGRSVTSEELGEVLDEIGIEDRQSFLGPVIYATTEDGQAVLLLVGEEGFPLGEQDDAAAREAPELQHQLAEGGLRSVQPDIHRVVLQGTMDGHAVFAIAAHDLMDASYVGAATTQVQEDGQGQGDAPSASLEESGVEVDEAVDARLFHASVDDRSVYFLVGPAGFAAGESLALEEADFRERLGDAGLQDVELLEKDLQLLRGDADGQSLLVIVGPLDHRTDMEH